MILIADSGSSKTNWSLVSENSEIQSCTTAGINPFYQDKSKIIRLLQEEFILPKNAITSVYFYGAGCTPATISVLESVLSYTFKVKSIEVNSDLLAAARSLCQLEEGIACILGTGSNSCYYDGEKIVQNVSPLGYILGDEGSGAVLGKKLIADILKNQLSAHLIQDFQSTYKLSAPEILKKVYRQPFPNRFLAEFTTFIAKHITDSEIKKLVEDSFVEFVQRNLFQYSEVTQFPVHFCGSVAYHFQSNLDNVFAQLHLKLGKIIQNPMSGLIEYHMNKFGT
jgi:N-acetylglucosamine kinase-like BadF-type ATPase